MASAFPSRSDQLLADGARFGELPNTQARALAGDRVYAIGDIHGRLDLFVRLIAAIRADNDRRPLARTRIVLLGDLVDRGQYSAQLVDVCRAANEGSDRFIVLRGNHEQVMVDALAGNLQALDLWLRIGGRESLASWGVAESVFEEGPFRICAAAREAVGTVTLAWLRRLPLSHAAGDYLLVHAGVRPGVALTKQAPDDLLWIRDEFLASDDDHGAIIVHGHTVNPQGVDVTVNRIGIDTGAWRTGTLTALGLEEDTRWTIATSGSVE